VLLVMGTFHDSYRMNKTFLLITHTLCLLVHVLDSFKMPDLIKFKIFLVTKLTQMQNCCCQRYSDGCCDALKVVFCHCCTTFQLGDHLFDYTNNTEITYEATPVVEIV